MWQFITVYLILIIAAIVTLRTFYRFFSPEKKSIWGCHRGCGKSCPMNQNFSEGE